MATMTRTVSKRAVYILLECFLVVLSHLKVELSFMYNFDNKIYKREGRKRWLHSKGLYVIFVMLSVA